MQLKVKLLSGKVMLLNFEADQTIYAIKEKIQDKEGIHPDQIKLVCSGKILENEKTIEDSKLNPNNMIHMVLNLRGGCN